MHLPFTLRHHLYVLLRSADSIILYPACMYVIKPFFLIMCHVSPECFQKPLRIYFLDLVTRTVNSHRIQRTQISFSIQQETDMQLFKLVCHNAVAIQCIIYLIIQQLCGIFIIIQIRKEESVNVSMQNESQRTFWYSAGAAYCISLPLMMKLEQYFR